MLLPKFVMEVYILVLFLLLLCCELQMVCLGEMLGHQYRIVDLEDSQDICRGTSSLVSNRIAVEPKIPVIVRLGYTAQASNVEKCRLKIKAPHDHGISLTINSMNLNFRRNQLTGSISCHDFVQFSRRSDSFLGKLSDKLMGSGKSDTICRRAYKMDTERPELYNVGKTANIYHTTKSEVAFEYERGSDRSRDKEFTIVATAFKRTNGSCPEQYIRCGTRSVSYCIAAGLRCDGFVNCGFPSSGVDEEGCADTGSSTSTHTFVWMTMVLALAVFICCLISCAMRCWVPSQSPPHLRLRLWFPGASRSPVESGPTSFSGPAAAAERAHLSPLPSYDSVVRHLGGPQSPPSYKDLFPEPPPTPPGTDRLPLHPLLKAADEPPSPPPPPPPPPAAEVRAV